MAEFCYDCTAEIFGDEYKTRNDLVEPGLRGLQSTLCEGCGWGLFDNAGIARPGGDA